MTGPTPQNTIRKAPLLALLFFTVLGIVGVTLHEPGRVLEQAWQVCLSCIGLG